MSYILLSRVEPPAAIAPKSSGFGWGGAFDALGFRLTTARNDILPSGVAFESAALGSVITKDLSSRVDSVVATSAMAVEDLNFDDLDDWWIKLGGSKFLATIRGEVDQVAGVQAITLRPKLEVSPWAAPTTVLVGFTFEVKIAPIGGSAASCRLMVPGVIAEMESEVWGWLDTRLEGAGMSWSFPGKIWVGDVSGLPYDEPAAILGGDHPATTADLYLWDDSPEAKETCPGACLRIARATGAGVFIRISRDGSNVITVSITLTCQDCSIGINGASDTDFAQGVQIRPMTGEDYDALRWCGEMEEAEGWAWAADGPIGTNPHLSALAEVLLVSGYADGGHLLADFQPYFECYARLIDFLELEDDEIAIQIYRAADDGIRPPNVSPMRASAATVIQAMHDAGMAVLLYEDLLEPWSKVSGSGVDATSVIWPSLARTRVGYSLPGFPDLGDQPISNGEPSAPSVKYHPNPVDAAALGTYFDEVEAEYAAEVGTKRRGSFQDTAGVAAPNPDDNAALAPNQRSVGSTTFAAATREWHRLRRQKAADAGIVDPALFAEFVNPMTTVGRIDLAYSLMIYPPAGIFYGRTCCSLAIKYGRFIKIATYYDWGSGHGPQWDVFTVPEWVTPLELRQYTYLRWFTSGLLLPMERIWLDADPTGFIVLPGEPGYEDYLAFVPALEFGKRLYLSNKPLRKALMTRGRRLRDLPVTSLKRRALAAEIDGIDPHIPEAKIGSMVNYLEAEDCVVLDFGNYSMVGGNPVTVEIPDTITRAGWPEMGAAPRDAYLINSDTREIRQIRGWDGSSYQFSDIDVAPGQAFTVLFTPAGQAPPFVSFQRDAPIVSTGSVSAPIVSIGSFS